MAQNFTKIDDLELSVLTKQYSAGEIKSPIKENYSLSPLIGDKKSLKL